MNALSARDIVGIWDRHDRQNPMRRALAVITAACPDLSPEEIASMSIGRRDLVLLTIRERTLGAQLDSLADCPRCGERVEFTTDIADISVGTFEAPMIEHEIDVDGCRLRFRLLDSRDLEAVAGARSVAEARSGLIARALVEARMDGRIVTADALPPSAVAALAEAMAERDPQAEVLFDLSCSICGHQWPVLFDIVSFLWDELRATAFELMRDVHEIAIKYGWSEDAILAMSAAKRKLYLEL